MRGLGLFGHGRWEPELAATPRHHKGDPIGEGLIGPARQELSWPGEWACARRGREHAPAHAPTQALTRAPVHASSWVSFAVLWPAPLLPPERGGVAGHGQVLSSKQLGRLGDGLSAVLGRVLLCCRQPALKVLQLALKVLYERLKVWGRVSKRSRSCCNL